MQYEMRIMQNKPNFRKAKMKLNFYPAKDYEYERLGGLRETNPILSASGGIYHRALPAARVAGSRCLTFFRTPNYQLFRLPTSVICRLPRRSVAKTGLPVVALAKTGPPPYSLLLAPYFYVYLFVQLFQTFGSILSRILHPYLQFFRKFCRFLLFIADFPPKSLPREMAPAYLTGAHFQPKNTISSPKIPIPAQKYRFHPESQLVLLIYPLHLTHFN